MTVILLDPQRPTLVPIDAIAALGGRVVCTEEVPEQIRTLLGAIPKQDTNSHDVALISTDPDNRVVRARTARGERVIAAPKLPGDSLVEAVAVMDRLWSYGGWEVTQTHDSLRHYLLEETYELLDAIQDGDPNGLREELGDLLLQVLFHSRIAMESVTDPFTVDDVAATLVAKLVHRSPHLAQDVVGPIDIATQERAWEERKAAEKARTSCLDGVAMAQPALALAEQVVSRAVKAGLPRVLVPEELTVVRLGGPDSAEDLLRRSVLEFVGRIRRAEAAATDAGLRRPLAPHQWSNLW